MEFPFNNNLDKAIFSKSVENLKNIDYVTGEMSSLIALVQLEIYNTIGVDSVSPEELNKYKKLSGLISDMTKLINLERDYKEQKIKLEALRKKESAINSEDINDFVIKLSSLVLQKIPPSEQLGFLSELEILKAQYTSNTKI